MKATNMDVEGFVSNLDASLPGWDKAPDRVRCGRTGGAALAAVFGHRSQRPTTLTSPNRNFDSVRGALNGPILPGPPSEAWLLVNATRLWNDGSPSPRDHLSAVPEDAIATEYRFSCDSSMH
jgi:shikimate dehydrogenase